MAFHEECVAVGHRFCRVFTLRQVKYCRRCVAMSAARSLVRCLSFATVLCSSSFRVVGEVRRLR